MDRKCVECHREKKAIPIDGEATDRGLSRSFESLRPYVNWAGGKQGVHFLPYELGGGSKSIPERFGAKASKLFRETLAKDHYGVKLTEEERRRLAFWIDCNTNYFGAYEATERQRKGELILPSLE